MSEKDISEGFSRAVTLMVQSIMMLYIIQYMMQFLQQALGSIGIPGATQGGEGEGGEGEGGEGGFFEDDFNDNEFNTNLWIEFGSGTLEETNQRLEVEPSSEQYKGCRSKNKYDLTGKSIEVIANRQGISGNMHVMGIYCSPDEDLPSDNYYSVQFINGDSVRFRKKIAGTTTDINTVDIESSPFKIKLVFSENKVEAFYDCGGGWTSLGETSLDLDPTMYIFLAGGGMSGNLGKGYFDNFKTNIPLGGQ